MKNFSTVLNLVLLAAVAVLYYLHFTHPSGSAREIPAAPLKSGNIVFVNSDSMLDQYDYFKNKKTEFDAKQEKIKTELKSESSALQNEIAEYQKNGAAMTDQQRRQTEEQLGMKQQRLMQKKDELLGKLDDEQGNTNDELYRKLNAFMKEFNKEKNYSFILSHQKGGAVLFANDSLDVTREVVAGLNKEYEKEKKESK